MKIALSSYVVFLMVLVSIPAQALEPLVLYDDFNTRLIDADKWFGSEAGDGGTEAIRLIDRGRLRLIYLAS
jgi:hypothetical protein